MHNSTLRNFGGSISSELVNRAEHFFRLSHLRAWFTPERRRLISARAVDELAASGTPSAFWRFLNGSPNVTFRIVGLSRYYEVLAHVGYVPPTPDEVAAALANIDTTSF